MSASILLGLRAFATLALYAFVGWAFYLLWQSLRAQAAFVQTQKPSPLKLEIETPGAAIDTICFEKSDISIGREETCDLRLEDSTISAQHARLSFHHGHWWAEDLGSRNGSQLNDDDLSIPTIIVSGDTLRCGHTSITIRFEK
jgi:pSer/pThr/pTyr-binding forkhead associated (FHA) protein